MFFVSSCRCWWRRCCCCWWWCCCCWWWCRGKQVRRTIERSLSTECGLKVKVKLIIKRWIKFLFSDPPKWSEEILSRWLMSASLNHETPIYYFLDVVIKKSFSFSLSLSLSLSSLLPLSHKHKSLSLSSSLILSISDTEIPSLTLSPLSLLSHWNTFLISDLLVCSWDGGGKCFDCYCEVERVYVRERRCT